MHIVLALHRSQLDNGQVQHGGSARTLQVIYFVTGSGFLLLVVYDGVVHLLAFGVRPFLRGGACLAIL